MISIIYLLSLYVSFLHYLAPQPEFIYNMTTFAQTCHQYNDKTYCCFDYPEYTLYTNKSKNVTKHYMCNAVKFMTLKNQFFQGIDYDYEDLEYE